MHVHVHKKSSLLDKQVNGREVAKDLVHDQEEYGSNTIIHHCGWVEVFRVLLEIQQANQKCKYGLCNCL